MVKSKSGEGCIALWCFKKGGRKKMDLDGARSLGSNQKIGKKQNRPGGQVACRDRNKKRTKKGGKGGEKRRKKMVEHSYKEHHGGASRWSLNMMLMRLSRPTARPPKATLWSEIS